MHSVIGLSLHHSPKLPMGGASLKCILVHEWWALQATQMPQPLAH
jgi:hypothetical protein